MSITYSNSVKRNRIVEPLFQKNKIRYRNVRNSQLENLETNLLKLDITRLYNQLSEIDTLVLDDIRIFVSDGNPSTSTILLDDGLTNEISDIDFYYDDTESLEQLEIDVINKLSGRLSRLLQKIQRLEKNRP